MDKKEIKQALTIFLKRLKKMLKADQVIVFGSQADGRATKYSDIDVIVLSSRFEEMNEDERLDILYDASSLIEPDIQPWGFTPKEAKQANPQTTLGDAYLHGIRIL